MSRKEQEVSRKKQEVSGKQQEVSRKYPGGGQEVVGKCGAGQEVGRLVGSNAISPLIINQTSFVSVLFSLTAN